MGLFVWYNNFITNIRRTMLLKAIDCETKEIDGREVTFVRVANHIGYFFKFNGEHYGTWIKYDQKETKESLQILETNYKETIKELIK